MTETLYRIMEREFATDNTQELDSTYDLATAIKWQMEYAEEGDTSLYEYSILQEEQEIQEIEFHRDTLQDIGMSERDFLGNRR